MTDSERDEFMHRYKMAAGFAAEKLNAAPPIIPAGAKVRMEAAEPLSRAK